MSPPGEERMVEIMSASFLPTFNPLRLFQKRSLFSPGRQSLLWGALLLAACGSDGSIDIEVYVPATINEEAPNSNVFDVATQVRIEVLQDGKVKRERTFAIGESNAEIGLLPFKDNVQVRVSALSGDDPPIVLGRGATGLLDLSREDDARRLGILVGRVQTFFPTTDINSNTTATEMGAARVGMTATEIGDGRVLLAGGTLLNGAGQVIAEEILDTLEIYDPSTGSYLPIPAKLTAPRAFHTATQLPDGRVLLVGGLSVQPNGSLVTLGTADIFDPASCGKPFDPNRCQVVPVGEGGARLTSERAGHTATLLANGNVLFIGGFRQNAAAPPEFIRTAEILAFPEENPAGVFLGAGQMPEARGLHAAALLPDGTSVLISGGRDSSQVFNTMLIFRDGVGFVSAGVMTAARFSHSLTPIGQDGNRFLIAGGFTQIGANNQGAAPTTSMDVADEQGNVINGTVPLGFLPNGAIAEHVAVPLEDGRVLIAGGSLTNNNSSDTAVVVRFFLSGGAPALDPVPTAEPMEFARSKATAIAHSSGGVLIFGGTRVSSQNGVENLSAGEVFVADLLP